MKINMQLSKLLQPLQHKVADLFQDPKFVKKYVDAGVLALGYTLIPLDAFMKHLLTVQGLDPKSNPRSALLETFSSAFTARHADEYDSEYDLSWVHKKFKKIREDEKWGDLTQETFVELTDISKVDDAIDRPLTVDPAYEALANQIVPECEKRELPLFKPEQERENLKEATEKLKKALKDVTSKLKEEVGSFDPGGNALDQLKDFITKTHGEPPALWPTKKPHASTTKKPGVKTTKKKLNKKTQKVARKTLATAKDREAHRASVAKRYYEAQELVKGMVDKGLCSLANVDDQIAHITLMPDDAVESLKRIIRDTHSTRTDTSSHNFKGAFRRNNY